VLVKYLHFVKSKLEGMAHTIHLLTAQNSAAKRSVSEVESSSQELLHCSLELIVMRRKGLRLTTNLRNKNLLHVTVLNFHRQQQVFNEGGQHTI
jgi:hypothetical protein